MLLRAGLALAARAGAAARELRATMRAAAELVTGDLLPMAGRFYRPTGSPVYRQQAVTRYAECGAYSSRAGPENSWTPDPTLKIAS